MLLGDLDGDGTEDAVFIVTGGSPLIGAGAFNYTVLDPYDGYWSFGDPKLNTHVAQTDAGPHYYVLVVSRLAGREGQGEIRVHQSAVQADCVSRRPKWARDCLRKNKKVVAAIATVESDGQQGAVFWNGRTYKFVQLGNQDD